MCLSLNVGSILVNTIFEFSFSASFRSWYNWLWSLEKQSSLSSKGSELISRLYFPISVVKWLLLISSKTSILLLFGKSWFDVIQNSCSAPILMGPSSIKSLSRIISSASKSFIRWWTYNALSLGFLSCFTSNYPIIKALF